jgi:hypothetical protein
MCEKPKLEDDPEPAEHKEKPRSYYYDDAHGYEDFDPEADEMDADDESESA